MRALHRTRTPLSRLTMNGLILVFLLCVFNHVVGEGIYVINGDQLNFTATENCKKKGATLEHRLKDGNPRRVAQWDNVWKSGPDYEDRMSPNVSLVIFNSSNINDDGLYEFTCGSEEEPIQVHVASSTNSSVTEGDSVRFPFFSVTAGTSGKFTVKRDGKLVFELDFLPGVVTVGDGFEGRVSVSPHWKTQGDFTVTLKGATIGDQGDYFFSVHKDGQRESLSAVRLRVIERVPDQTTSSPPPVCPTQNVTNETQTGTWTAVLITAAVVIITASVCFLIGWYMKTRCMKTRSSKGPPGPGAENSDVELQPIRGPPGSQMVNGGPNALADETLCD